ncbi:hypothetical protein LJR045_000962 [Microbacterium sp. LjRoot45]|uniref:hypothetical protein n=1 Tax=Microbacterium sp. LjRoot45 TaxID=3342329 RepID=UPI003ECD402B
MTPLQLVSHPLPVAWDGRAVVWDRWEAPAPMFLCPDVKREPCSCGSTEQPFTARGRRDPSEERVAAAAQIPQIRRRAPLVWAVYDLHAFRCPSCGQVSVWDMASDEWWTLDDTDYGPTGSRPPPEWGTGGLLDLLNDDIHERPRA